MSADSFDNQPSPDERDPLSDLLARDAAAHPVTPSPWFAARTAALTRSIPQSASPFGLIVSRVYLKRWMLPIPLAGLAALLLLALSHQAQPSGKSSLVSSEADFEEHIEMLFAYGN